MNDQEILRFCKKVEQDGQCWVWTGARNKLGYGRVKIRKQGLYPHRVIFEYLHGPIPEGLVIDHTCHNRACVDPNHLRLGSQKQNVENAAGLRSDNKSGYRGVCWVASKNKWRAGLSHNGKPIFLGYFDDREVAAAVAQDKRNELFTFNDADRMVQP